MSYHLCGVVLSLLAFATGTASAQQTLNTSSCMHFVPETGIGARQLIALCAIEGGKQPIACFGLTKLPGEEPRYSYLLIFKPPSGKPKGGIGTECKGSCTISDEDFHLDFQGQVKVVGKMVEVAYQFKYDAEKKAIKDEVLKLGGKEISTEGPRVFLVDLGAEKMTYTPLKGEKLDLLPRHLDKGGYENGVLETIEKLKKAAPG